MKLTDEDLEAIEQGEMDEMAMDKLLQAHRLEREETIGALKLVEIDVADAGVARLSLALGILRERIEALEALQR